jgi:sucrose-phosphate synthase
MAVIPPGTDLDMFYPPGEDENSDFGGRLDCFLTDPDKPMVLAISRPDERKNISVLLDAFGESEALRKAANLLIIAGNRDDIRDLDDGARSVLTELLIMVDSYNLYGHVAIPKRHGPGEIPMIYRAVSAGGGIFINPALTEPFGLTLLEAAASGLPLVATENGGPVDIISNCNNGILIDPLDSGAIADALLHFLENPKSWSEASQYGLEGVRRNYTWKAHARRYLEKIQQLSGRPRKSPPEWKDVQVARYRDRAIFSDLDHTLMDESEGLQDFMETIKSHRKRVSFGIATGRRVDSALAVIKKYGIPSPDVLISSLGTRIHYGSGLTEDSHWAKHIDHDWNRDRIRQVIHELPGVERQPRLMQSKFKVSYYYDPQKAPPLEDIVQLLHQQELTANVLLSFGQYLDIIPSRASLGQALRYTALRLDIPLEHVLAAGGSGNDEDMIRGNTLAVVTADRRDEELSSLVDLERVYFSDKPHAAGILDAIAYYDFFDSCRVPGK